MANRPIVFRTQEEHTLKNNHTDAADNQQNVFLIDPPPAEKFISVTSPGNSRSTSPNLNDLLTKRSECESLEFNGDANENHLNTEENGDKLVAPGVNERDGYHNNMLIENLTETESVTSSSSPINTPKRKQGPLGKRALLKKLSEGTLVRRQSERHLNPQHKLSSVYSATNVAPNTNSKTLRRRTTKAVSKDRYRQPVELLDLEGLKRYRKVYKLSIRPTAPKSKLLRMAMEHYSSMNPDPYQIISKFVFALQSDRS